MKNVLVDIERCTACKSCEIACAIEHSTSKNLFAAVFEAPLPRKRIHVEKALSLSYPSRCVHCVDPVCAKACPTGAMQRDPESGRVLVNEKKCIGCLMCSVVCPFGAISAGPSPGVAVKCDLCGSRVRAGKEPACVEACPTRALVFEEQEEISREKRIAAAETVARAVGQAKEVRS